MKLERLTSPPHPRKNTSKKSKRPPSFRKQNKKRRCPRDLLPGGFQNKSLNRRIRNELRKQANPWPRRAQQSSQAKKGSHKKEKIRANKRGSIKYSEFQQRYSSVDREKRSEPSNHLRSMASPEITRSIQKLKQIGFSEEKLSSNNLQSILDLYMKTSDYYRRSNKPEPQRRSSSRRGQVKPAGNSYRDELFQNLKKSFNLRHAKSDEKESRKFSRHLQRMRNSRPQSSAMSPSKNYFYSTVNQMQGQGNYYTNKSVTYKNKKSFSIISDKKQKSQQKKRRKNQLKIYKYKNAILTRDSKSKKGIIIYRTGEVFFGNFDESNKIYGFGIFFFPYCGFVYGKFDENKIHGYGVFKEPDSTFGIGEFNDGVFENFHIHFNLNSLTANRSKLFNKNDSCIGNYFWGITL